MPYVVPECLTSMIHSTLWNTKIWDFPALVLPGLLTNDHDLQPTGLGLIVIGEADTCLDI